MSKREIRAKRLVAAVLLAISVQMWSAPPLWAAEASVQTETSAAGEAKETKDAKDAKAADSETGGEVDAGEEETVVVPVIGYSTRSAAGSDYGVMPLADTAVDGALTGVTSINDAKFYADSHDLLLGYDAKSQGTGTVALGSDANAGGQYSTAIGASASATAENSSALGMYARAGFKDSVAIGFSSNATADNMVSFGVTENGGSTWTTRRSLEGIANIDMEGTINLGGTWTRNATSGAYESNGKGKLTGLTSINDTEVFIGNDGDALVVNIGAYLGPDAMGTISLGQGNYVDGTYAISLGYNVTTIGSSSVSIGAASQATEDYSTALGGDAYADGVDSTAIGHMSRIEGKNSTALGANSTVAAEHTNSVAIGSESATSAADQVSFGHKAGDKQSTSGSATYDTDLFRSLTNISDIDMHGNISLGGEWSWNETSKLYESNGKGRLTGLTSINDMDVFFGNDGDGTSIVMGTTLGYNSISVVGLGYGGTIDGESAVYVGNNAFALGNSSVAIGAGASARESLSTALGGDTEAAGENSTAVGYGGRAKAENSVTLGYNAKVGEGHSGSVAVGAYSATTAENQVAFGTGKVTTVDGKEVVSWSDRRSLAGISDIDMHGNISLGGEWKENTTSGLYESNGKGELNGVTSINGVIFAKDSMNNDGGLLIGTLASGTSFYGDTSVMIGLNIDNSAIDAVGIGNNIKLTGDGSVAIGYGAEAMSNMAMYPTAIGFSARAIGDEVVAIGGSSYAVHEFSVALGDDSSTSAENQVSFGHKAGDKYGDGGRDTYRDDLFRRPRTGPSTMT